MRVLFLYSYRCDDRPERPVPSAKDVQYGISIIAALLEREGHEVELLALARGRSGQPCAGAVEAALARFQPDVVAATAVSTEYPFLCRVAALVRRFSPKSYLVAGGPHVTLNPESCTGDPFDAWCIGEGEFPMVDLLAQLGGGQRPRGIANWWFRRDGAIERNASRPFISDLDALPFPNRRMWLPFLRDERAQFPVLMGRGCAFKCTYCSNHALREQAPGVYVRYRRPRAIVEEIEALLREFPRQTTVYLEIETLSRRSFLLELCDRLAAFNAGRVEPIRFGTNLRITRNLDDQFFQAMDRANIRWVTVGLESGSERIRQEVLLRNESNEDIRKNVERAHRFGIEVFFYVLLGIPGESFDDYLETVRITRECQVDGVFPSIFFPYPGTELYKRCVATGLIEDGRRYEVERTEAHFDLPGFSRAMINDALTWFHWRVFDAKDPYGPVPLRVRLGRHASRHRAAHGLWRLARAPYRWGRRLLTPTGGAV